MNLLFAGIGAIATALLEVALVPYLAIGDAHLHPVLVGAVVCTVALGLEGGVVWAVVGGLALDVMLTDRPLGASVVALLIAVGVAFIIATSLFRVRALAPVLIVPLVSLGYSMLIAALVSSVRQTISPAVTGPLLLPGAIYDTVLAIVVGPLTVSLHDRRVAEDRPEW